MSSPHPPKKSKKRNVLDIFRTFSERATLHNSATPLLPAVKNDSANMPVEQDKRPQAQDDILPAQSQFSSEIIEKDATLPKSPSQPFSSFPASKSTKRGLNVVWNGMQVALRLLEKSADACPPLKSAVGALIACLDLREIVVDNHEEYEKLAADLTSMMEALTPYVPKLVEEGVSGSLARIMKLIEEESKHIVQQLGRGKIMRTIEANQDQGDVIQRYRRIESLFRQLHTSINLQTWESTRKLLEKNLLDPLAVKDARYNSSYSLVVYRRGCTADTRRKILEDLKTWVVDQNGAKIYWMNGLAGTGKTTISYSLCEWLEENRLLGGNYFCSRASPSCRNASNIVPSIAYQLSQYSPAFGLILCGILQSDPDASTSDVRCQFKKLIQEPMQTLMLRAAIIENVIVVIDALDECDNGDTLPLLLDTLLKLVTDLPIKFFITSRPESVVREKMLTSGQSHLALHLHDVEESIVEADIKKYLTEALGSMSPPPSPNDIEQLTRRAGKLFIYAATAVRYIHPSNRGVNSRARLQIMLGMDPKPNKQYGELNRLYMDILSTAVNPKYREEQEVDDILLILRTVICTKEPMTIPTLASLLTLTAEQVYFALQPLQSILHTQETGEGLVTPFHASFPDFLFDKHRSGEFHCEMALHNELLANHCFDVMKRDLKFNICHLGSSFVFDKDVPDLQGRIKHSISTALSYACQYWGEHFQQGDLTDKVHTKLFDFMTHQLLFWMEVLNLQQCIAIGVEVLRRIQIRLKGSYPNTWKQIADAEVFLTRLTAGPCMRSTPHIYISGLAFCPRTSSVYKNYFPWTQGLIDVKESVVEHWQSKLLHTWTIESRVMSIAFSPDGTRIAAGFHDNTIHIWDARTGETIVDTLRGHTKCVNVVLFSHDNTHIVSGCDDCTIRVWDTQTGEVVIGPLEGHKSPIISASLSPDGIHLVSVCSHGEIKVWDIRTGEAVAGPFGGMDKWIDVAFSPDSNQIVSISPGGDMKVWDTWTGDTIAGPFKESSNPDHAPGTPGDHSTSHALSPDSTRVASGFYEGTIEIKDAHSSATLVGPFQADSDSQSIELIVFSPDSTCIVSASCYYTICVWDAHTGDALAGPFNGHTDLILSIAFSPDNTRIVSGSYDQTIRIWDIHTENVTTSQFTGHTNAIRSVAFSPDNTCIASASDDQTIRVWDTCTGDAVTGPFNGHTDSVTSVAFSPDNTHIVSGSNDQTIRVWDAHTGDILFGPLKGHTSSVNSVTFSPDGTRIASGSKDKTIRMWDAQTGEAMLNPLEGHHDWINSIDFSPDGSYIVSGSDDFTFRVWDVHTGDVVAFNAHSVPVNTVAFSPDGTRVASGACDWTVRVWDSHTGEEVAGPFVGHTDWVNSISFSPDGSHIVSCSDDCTIRVWDALAYAGGDKAGNSVSVVGPLKGHMGRVYSVAFSADGTHVVSGSDDQTIRVWDASVGLTGQDTNKTSTDLSICRSLFSSQTLLSNLSIGNLIFQKDGWIIADHIPLFWIPPHFGSQLLYNGNTLVIGSTGSPLIIDSSYLFIGPRWSQCWHS